MGRAIGPPTCPITGPGTIPFGPIGLTIAGLGPGRGAGAGGGTAAKIKAYCLKNKQHRTLLGNYPGGITESSLPQFFFFFKRTLAWEDI